MIEVYRVPWPTDSSEAPARALDDAIDFARRRGASLRHAGWPVLMVRVTRAGQERPAG
jgi:nucleotide-binding universal stress UspA family protein